MTAPVLTRRARPELFVDAAWVWRKRDDPSLRIVDLRGRSAHRAGHVPGANALGWADLVDPVDGSVVDAIAFAGVMSEIGIGDEHVVVAYDQHEPSASLHFVWALRRYGHEAAVALAGGAASWIVAGYPLSRTWTPQANGHIRVVVVGGIERLDKLYRERDDDVQVDTVFRDGHALGERIDGADGVIVIVGVISHTTGEGDATHAAAWHADGPRAQPGDWAGAPIDRRARVANRGDGVMQKLSSEKRDQRTIFARTRTRWSYFFLQ